MPNPEEGLPSFIKNPDPNIYLGDNYVAFDFETTNRDYGAAVQRDNRLLLSTWTLGRDHPKVLSSCAATSCSGVYFEHGEEAKELQAAISVAEFVVCQNGKFEYQWLSRLGVDISRILLYDTYLASYVQAGNRRGRRDLESIAKENNVQVGKVALVSKLIDGGVCPSEIPTSWLVEYGCQDTRLTEQIFLKQREVLAREGLLPTLFTRCITTPVLAEMEMRGVQLDPAAVKEKYDEIATHYGDISRELSRITGNINLNSPKQVGSYLYDILGFGEPIGRDGKPDRTEAGGRRTDADTIGTLRGSTPAQIEFVEFYKKYRKVAKSFETLEKMNECCEKDQGLLYASYNQAVTQTHRLSSSGKKYKLQFHNFDRGNKPLFKSRNTGWSVGEADGKQLEFRVAAHLGRDSQALKDIKNPQFDAHYQTAEQLLKKLREDISKYERTEAKSRTFKPLYGGGSGTPDEKRYYKFFQEKYNGIYSTQKEWTLQVLRDKKLRTETGLIFYWSDTKMSKSGYIENTTSIFNYPVQSLATADIIPISLVYLWHRAKILGLKLFLVNTVHDSIIAELPPEEQEIFNELCKKSFTEDVFRYLLIVYGISFTVPLGTEIKIGDRWGKGKEVSFDLDPDIYFKESGNLLQ